MTKVPTSTEQRLAGRCWEAKTMSVEPIQDVVFEPLAVDTETAARLLGLSVSTVRENVRRGDLVPHYSGTKPIFLVDELKAFLAALPNEPRHL